VEQQEHGQTHCHCIQQEFK